MEPRRGYKRVVKINALKHLIKHTYKDTSKEFGISTSTLSGWRANEELYNAALEDQSKVLTYEGEQDELKTETVTHDTVEEYLAALLQALQVEIFSMSHSDMIRYAVLLKAIISEKTFAEKRKHQSVLEQLLERYEREGGGKPTA